MHPAVSVIFFTVMSGAGFGLIAMIGLGFPMHDGFIPAFLACLLGGGLAVAGLISSTFHLGHPERAWRAFSQWRSSWLSREGILAMATLLLFALYALVWMYYGTRIAPLGWVISALSLVTVYATAMIYTQLKTVPDWHTWLTPVCYLAFSVASGFLAAAAIGTATTLFNIQAGALAFAALSIAWLVKIMWWIRSGTIGFSQTESDTGTATGLGTLGKVRLLEKPHSGENYLTREMVHRIGRKHAAKLRLLSLLAGAVVPLILSFGAMTTPYAQLLLGLAFASMIFGLFTERWLFFAEAKHAVSLYYKM